MTDEHPELAWTDIWARMDRDERHQATEAFVRWLRHGPDNVVNNYAPGFLRAFARHVRFRPNTLKQMKPRNLAALLAKHCRGFFDERDWPLLFQSHYMDNHAALMCRFLDLCGIPHDDTGAVTVKFDPPPDVLPVAEMLTQEYGRDVVIRYFMVLLLHEPGSWAFVRPALRMLLADEDATACSPQEPPPDVEEDAEEASGLPPELGDEFTQLDRVLIDQIVTTAAREERGLSPEQLLDLIGTVHALDTRRNRTYFHLGLMDALLPMQDPDVNRPEMNDKRREWYLAGLLAGFARKRDMDSLLEWIERCQGDFQRAAATPGGAGASMANTLFDVLTDADHDQPALTLLRGQIETTGPGLRWAALNRASGLLRDGEIAAAKAILDVLHDFIKETGCETDDEEKIGFCARVCRKIGQAYQAAGDLVKARKFFAQLLENPSFVNADLLADIGLAEAGFATLQQVSLGGDGEQRSNTREALESGRPRFEEAIARFGDEATHAHYLLAVSAYLEYMDKRSNDEIRESALRHAESALAGMLGSKQEPAYRRLGLLGRCRFMLATMRLASLDPALALAAKRQWDRIDPDAGLFAEEHLAKVLDWAELVDRNLALEIGESIWRTRGGTALTLLRGHDWLAESPWLRGRLVDLARDENQARQERFDLWTLLVPALIRAGDSALAEEGLDTLESLVDDDVSTLGDAFLEWITAPENTDPVWTEADRLRARYRVLRRQGNDEQSFAELRNLFFALRNHDPEEATQLIGLFKEQNAPPEFWRDLTVPECATETPDDDREDIEVRLREGEQVRVLFIGGNEIQARYDERIRGRITRDWPGVEIEFEHTGWSSNWGTIVDKLRKKAEASDAVVLMSMMRTMLGRTMRAALNDPPRPWVPCTGRGHDALERSIRRAVIVGMKKKNKP